jgi:hypothetical protein
VPRLLRGVVAHGIRGGIPANRQDRFLLVCKNEQQLKQVVGFQQSDDAWLLLLDETGSIQGRHDGPVSDTS